VLLSCSRRHADADATFIGDLRRFTTSARTWTDLSGSTPLHGPSARAYHRLVSSGDTIYLFGGSSDEGEKENQNCKKILLSVFRIACKDST
jgi:hypothetical protein